jgi:hypothetical protein
MDRHSALRTFFVLVLAALAAAVFVTTAHAGGFIGHKAESSDHVKGTA